MLPVTFQDVRETYSMDKYLMMTNDDDDDDDY